MGIAIILAAASFGWGYGLRLKRGGHTVETALSGPRGWVIFCFMTVCLLGMVFLSKYSDFMSPKASSLLNHVAWDITKGLLGFLGAMSVPLSADRRPLQLSSILLLVVLAMVLVQRMETYVFAPLYPAIREDRRTPEGYVLQTQDTTCTAASLANLLAYYGRRTTEYACAKAMGTTRFGSTTGDLVRGLRQFGFQPLEVLADAEHLRALNRPAILAVWHGRARHSVLWVGQRADGMQLIVDPLTGRKEVPGSELWKSLSSSRAFAVSVTPPSSASRAAK